MTCNNSTTCNNTIWSTVSTVVSVLVALLGPYVIVTSIYAVKAKARSVNCSNEGKDKNIRQQTSIKDRQSIKVPFFYVPSDLTSLSENTATQQPSFRELSKAMEDYRADVAKALYYLERAAILAYETERVIIPRLSNSGQRSDFMARRIREKRGKLAEILEADGFVLEKMLCPFPVVYALPETSSHINRAEDSPLPSCLNNDEAICTSIANNAHEASTVRNGS